MGFDLNLNLHLNLIGKKGSGGRERAITLAGDESKPSSPVPGATPSSPLGPGAGAGTATATATVGPPLASPPSLAWRASTGRHDLSHRQLVLLREMLHKADSDSASLRADNNSLPAGDSSIPEEQPPLNANVNVNVNVRPQQAMSPVSLNVNKEWRWGDAMSSTVTLPSEESGRSSADPRKKRRYSRLGMSGFRDMLRALKKNYNDAPPPLPAPPPPPPVLASSTSLSTENSSLDQRLQHSHAPPAQGRRRAKTSFGPESIRMSRPTSPYNPPSLTSKPSPRRPSLASIFRIGHKNKQSPSVGHDSTNNGRHPPRSTSSQSKSASSSAADGDEEDWDRIDSASDLDAAARALGIKDEESGFGSATVRGKGSPYLLDPPPPLPSQPLHLLTSKRSVSGSQSSIWGAGGAETCLNGPAPNPNPESPPSLPGTRSTRLSNVEEHVDDYRHTQSSKMGHSSSHIRDPKAPKNGSVRSMPPHPISSGLPDPKLAMTPENIRPLVENAKEVHARLNECIAEIRSLLSIHADLDLERT